MELFGRPGASIPRYCWCMHYRRSGADDRRTSAAGNKQAMKALVDGGTVPGLIAYREGRPVGWISLGPRSDSARLAGSRVMRPVDDKPVWSIVCFFMVSMWFGAKSLFDRAGFREVARRKPERPVMRRKVRPDRSGSQGSG